VWTLDGTRLISAGSYGDPSIREWDASTWQQVGDPWTGHTNAVWAIAIHPTGTLIASASHDNHVRLWSLLDRQTIAIFLHSSAIRCVTFSMDGNLILSGDNDKQVSEWAVPKDVLLKDALKAQVAKAQCYDLKILAIDMTIRNACITGDLTTAEQLLTQEIDVDANSCTSYANRSFVMARQLDWDRALHDANKSVSIQPSLLGYISKGIALCGKQQVREAMTEFDLAFTSTDGDSKTTLFLFLIKAIALFNANNHEEAVRFVQELAARPSANPLASCVVEAYLQVQLGNIAMDNALYKEAVNHFTAAVNAGAFFSKSDIHSMYEDFVVLFGWDLKSLWQIANQQRCYALIRGCQFGAALESYRYMMDMSDEPTKAIFLAWAPTLNEEWTELHVANGNAALATSGCSCMLKHGN
jgi:tetratricopeptide (TPR) repeat protein